MTLPTPNRGLQAAALAQVQWAVRLLEKALPNLGVETEVGKDVMRSLTTLGKHIPAGSTSPGVESNALAQMQNQARQDAPLLSLLRARMMGGAPAAPTAPTTPPAV